ncbi:MAG: hypothetical protein RMK32_05610 [Anaerolineae bacterium]|nr:hypothetical protein [Anaerolineae bacterium]
MAVSSLLRMLGTRASSLLWALVVLVYLAYGVVFGIYAASLLQFPFDYDQGEGFELLDAVYFSRGEWPYRDIETYPFYASNYPPLFHLLAVPLVWAFGPRLIAGRLLSTAATVTLAAAVGLAVGRWTRRWMIGLWAGGMVLASNYVYHIGPLSRSHMTMVLFETLAVLALAREEDFPSRRSLLLGSLALMAAGWTKQHAIITVLAVFAYLFLRRPRAALTWAIPFAGVNLALFALIDLATGGYWSLHIIEANINEYDYRQAFFLYSQWFRLHAVVLLLAAALVLYELYFDRLSLLSIWAVFAAAGGALAGKWGAGESYFITAVVAAILAAGRLIARVERWTAGRPMGRAAAALLIPVALLGQAGLVFHLPTDHPWTAPVARGLGLEGTRYVDTVGYTQLGHLPTAEDVRNGWRIVEFVREAPGPAFTEEASWALWSEKEPVTNPTQLLNLYKNGKLNPERLIRMIEQQAFGIVVLRAQFYPQPVLEAIGRSYRPIADIPMNGFIYRILAPRRPSSPLFP